MTENMNTMNNAPIASDTSAKVKAKNPVEAFVEGAVNGINIIMKSTVPNVVFAFIIIKILNMTGFLDLIGTVMSPVMAIFGLPGVSATVLLSSILSMGGGCGVAASLATSGMLSNTDITILMPAIPLMGTLVQYMGRILSTAGLPTKYYAPCYVIAIVNGLLSMLVMRVILGV